MTNKQKAIDELTKLSEYLSYDDKEHCNKHPVRLCIDKLKSLLESEEESKAKVAIYCNDNQWHCCKCDAVVYEGRLNCRRCGQELYWPDEAG